ncbi:hypothetical protein AURDEDRAFT_169584 [Auricularia subglabra TFB-10046 SS5]|uniref:Uncharacterized protein n=1 Tax=Auricularia subglabra (strain TFB-10046 / SS5) TaxID=717982 RepID=J0WXE7_AURST|nr:hypothetical protein AURDEDRAFT_169584 [Auricularia subglabra TFB-10046 SS5]
MPSNTLGESPADLYIEHTNFASAIVGSFLYGAQFIIVLIAPHYFLRGKPWREVQWGWLAYTVLLFVGSTLYMAASVKWASQMFIDERNYPGGPVGYYLNAYNTPMIIFGNAAFIYTNFLADGFMARPLILYRTWIIWDRSWWIVCFPIIVYLASTIMSILTVYQLAQPGAQFFSTIGLALTLPYFSLSISLNLLLTVMIVTKLLAMRRRLRTALGTHHARMYTGMPAMLVESAALYAVFSIMFIATYSINNSLFNVCLPIQARAMGAGVLSGGDFSDCDDQGVFRGS